VAIESRAIQLQLGRWRWLLLPDRQALWAWRQLAAAGSEQSVLRGRIDGVWLGFAPSARERHHLKELGAKRLWLSGAIPAGLPAAWAASGPSGYLQAALG
jgi:competence protein ComEC